MKIIKILVNMYIKNEIIEGVVCLLSKAQRKGSIDFFKFELVVTKCIE